MHKQNTQFGVQWLLGSDRLDVSLCHAMAGSPRGTFKTWKRKFRTKCKRKPRYGHRPSGDSFMNKLQLCVIWV